MSSITKLYYCDETALFSFKANDNHLVISTRTLGVMDHQKRTIRKSSKEEVSNLLKQGAHALAQMYRLDGATPKVSLDSYLTRIHNCNRSNLDDIQKRCHLSFAAMFSAECDEQMLRLLWNTISHEKHNFNKYYFCAMKHLKNQGLLNIFSLNEEETCDRLYLAESYFLRGLNDKGQKIFAELLSSRGTDTAFASSLRLAKLYNVGDSIGARALKALSENSQPTASKTACTETASGFTVTLDASSAPGAQIPQEAFGAAKWREYFDADVGQEPPLPQDMADTFERLKKTTTLTLIPATLNGKPFNLTTLQERLAEHGRQFYATLQIEFDKREVKLSTHSSYWVLMERSIYPKSANKTYKEQLEEAKKLDDHEFGKEAKMADSLSFVTSFMMEHTASGAPDSYSEDKRLFNREFIHCSDLAVDAITWRHDENVLFVGGRNCHITDLRQRNRGFAVLKKSS